MLSIEISGIPIARQKQSPKELPAHWPSKSGKEQERRRRNPPYAKEFFLSLDVAPRFLAHERIANNHAGRSVTIRKLVGAASAAPCTSNLGRDPAMGREDHTTVIQGWLDRLHAGDDSAREKLLTSASGRLARLARKMLKGYPGVARWEQEEDVLQNALIRLDRSLRAVKPPTAKDFFGLASAQIRRELIDLARHYYGPSGLGANYSTQGSEYRATEPGPPADSTCEPSRLATWTEFHFQIEGLPDGDRELFDLLWYQGLTQAEAAAVLGASERTVNKRWIAARLRLRDALGGQLPGS